MSNHHGLYFCPLWLTKLCSGLCLTSVLNPTTGSFPINTHVAYVNTYLAHVFYYGSRTGEVRMLEPDSFATNNLFPAGKSEKTWGFLVETPHEEKTLAR